ncbi:hypothetical protein [Isoptericola sp. NPDC056605]|uniref:hypothetical protein n=1 Tax=Isoptericola sp. NPDC056605 TaxID=3345876 RepID=UPI0036D17D06
MSAPVPPDPSEAAALDAAWSSLADELDGDRAAVARFAASWVGLLAGRVGALDRALRRGDHEAVRDALLSFGCTSTMLGVEGLAGAADRALEALAHDGVPGARRHLDDVSAQSRSATLLVVSTLAQGRWSNR